MKLISLFAFLFVFASSRAIDVEFGESDYKVSEREEFIEVFIGVTEFSMRSTHEGVTLEVVPMTLNQYIDTTGGLPDGVSLEEDPAEPDLDFNSSSHFVTVKPGMRNIRVKIDIFNDEISELEEVFLVHLRVASPHQNSSSSSSSFNGQGSNLPLVTVGRDVSVIHITEGARGSRISLSRSELYLEEGRDSGEQLFLEFDRSIEPSVFLKMKLRFFSSPDYFTLSAEDLSITAEVNITLESSHRIAIPIDVVDDNIAEQVECTTLMLTSSSDEDGNSPHYSIFRAQTLICIVDNDLPQLGIQPREEGGELEMMEGERKELCVVLLKPDACSMYITMIISLSPVGDTSDIAAVDVNLEESVTYSPTDTYCFEVAALNNSALNAPVTLQFDIETNIFYGNAFISGQGVISTVPGILTIRDDDGTPLEPEGINIEASENRVRVSWEAPHSSALQPIDNFIVVVQAATRTRTENNNNNNNNKNIQQQQTLPPPQQQQRSRRAVEVVVPSLAPGDSWEHETNRTDLELLINEEEEEETKSYMIYVCTENALGRTCSTGEPVRMLPKMEAHTLGLEEVRMEEKKLLSSPLVIAIAVVVPLMLLVLAAAVVGVVIMCKCCAGDSKEYFPSRQGTPHEEKYVFGELGPETRYMRRQLSTSTVSMEWTTGEPYCSPFVANRASISTIATPTTFTTTAPNSSHNNNNSSSSSSNSNNSGSNSDNSGCNTPSNARKHSSQIMGTPV